MIDWSLEGAVLADLVGNPRGFSALLCRDVGAGYDGFVDRQHTQPPPRHFFTLLLERTPLVEETSGKCLSRQLEKCSAEAEMTWDLVFCSSATSLVLNDVRAIVIASHVVPRRVSTRQDFVRG